MRLNKIVTCDDVSMCVCEFAENAGMDTNQSIYEKHNNNDGY